MKRINCIALCAASVAPVLWGCTLGPDFTQPRPATPASFAAGTATASPAQTIKIDAAPADEGAWWALWRSGTFGADCDGRRRQF
jgi:hypothetical protein